VNRPEIPLTQAVTAYTAGLDAEIVLLRQLDRLAGRQREADAVHDVEVLTQCTDERTQLMASLVALEHQLRPVRDVLADSQRQAAVLPGFVALVQKHREAAALVAQILHHDQQTLDALRDAEQARRFAAQTIEAGETTLAAYRRVVAPPPSHAALIDERG
jgi:hypothetical protein